MLCNPDQSKWHPVTRLSTKIIQINKITRLVVWYFTIICKNLICTSSGSRITAKNPLHIRALNCCQMLALNKCNLKFQSIYEYRMVYLYGECLFAASFAACCCALVTWMWLFSWDMALKVFFPRGISLDYNYQLQIWIIGGHI